MSAANVEIIQSGYEAMRRGDIEGLLEFCDPEMEFVSLVGQVEGHDYVGYDGLRRFFADLSEVWEVWEPDPGSIEAGGDHVLALGRTRVRGRGSGVEMEFDWGHVFQFRDGKVVWARLYGDEHEAREAFRERARG
jgi:uncharacterized protein